MEDKDLVPNDPACSLNTEIVAQPQHRHKELASAR